MAASWTFVMFIVVPVNGVFSNPGVQKHPKRVCTYSSTYLSTYLPTYAMLSDLSQESLAEPSLCSPARSRANWVVFFGPGNTGLGGLRAH